MVSYNDILDVYMYMYIHVRVHVMYKHDVHDQVCMGFLTISCVENTLNWLG